MSVVNRGLLFDSAFTTTDPVDSEAIRMSEGTDSATIFVAATSVNVSTVLQVEDPLGTWHTFTTATVTSAGACDAIFVPANSGNVRARMTPYAGSGSARAWAQSSGG